MAERKRARLIVAVTSASGPLSPGTEVEAGGEFRISQLEQLVAQGKAEWVETTRTATVSAPERATVPRRKTPRRIPKE